MEAATPPGDAGMEATPRQRPALASMPTDPSQMKQQHQQPCSNPNPNPNPNPNFHPAYNMQPAWVGSQQLQLQSCSSGIAVGVPANSPSPARPCMSSSMGMPQHTSMSPAVGLPHPQPTIPPQNFQGHGSLRAPSVLPSTSTPSNSQSQLLSRQPWLSTQHGRPPISSLRPQVTSQTLQQRPHIPQQSLQPLPASSQPQQMLSFPQPQQHFSASIHSQDNSGQQLLSSRNPQPVINQQQISRVQASGNQRPPPPVMGQTSIMHSGPTDNIATTEALESCTRILSKRSIQELVSQVDPLEKLDPEVEDVLVEIADDFIDSVTTFGCSLAKHRKSNTLEAKDILLHLERTWNMTLPGFSGDEIKTYKKPVANEIHKERLAVIKKSYWS
ncbi:transcription initiation factor TFIID subunit 12 [Silene latifolia]|uniref:transcription initiation factor TFIID subunit 12 n=1 Tax=Silene latifolia TaxID=37657 RepID=UPI003D780171